MADLVSIVVPAHNEEETIADVLEALLRQAYEPKEILVVNDHSTDRTAEIVGGFEGVKQIINEQNLGLARGMNVGLKEAKGEILMVLHADCIPETEQWVGQMVAPFSDPKVGAVVSQRFIADRSKLTFSEKLFDSIAPQQFLNPTGKLVETSFFRDKCDAYRGSVIRELGYFDDKSYFVAGEDTALSMDMKKAGYKIMISGEARIRYVFSSHQRSLKSVLLKKAMQYGGAAAKLYRDYGYDGLETRTFLATLIAFLLIPLIFCCPWVACAGYAALVAVSFTFKARLRGVEAPMAFMHLGIFFVGALAIRADLHILFSWSVVVGFTLHLLHVALRSVRHTIRERDPITMVPAVFLYALCWRLLSGFGYLVGRLKLRQVSNQADTET
ncbi:MAG: glycosyltransferase [Planctomycetes bacterium]|nr:glycosyltransferase [Planctomycetota bacterium]